MSHDYDLRSPSPGDPLSAAWATKLVHAATHAHAGEGIGSSQLGLLVKGPPPPNTDYAVWGVLTEDMTPEASVGVSLKHFNNGTYEDLYSITAWAPPIMPSGTMIPADTWVLAYWFAEYKAWFILASAECPEDEGTGS